MKEQKVSKEIPKMQDTNSSSKPRMCGTLMIWIGMDKQKQKQQKKLQKYLEKEFSESKQLRNLE